jgi:hypothetical protein
MSGYGMPISFSIDSAAALTRTYESLASLSEEQNRNHEYSETTE